MQNHMIPAICLLSTFIVSCSNEKSPLRLETLANTSPKNIIYILSDDHRFDFMGFTGKVPWLETPNLDRLANEGAYFPNTYVTTSLCSPSRASILTGLYSHTHTVIDNAAPDPGNLTFFPQYLQEAGYQTSYFGKWHMGNHSDEPQPGFDHWESFRGQGVYYGPTLNINGERTTYDQSTYITDVLTEHAVDWLDERNEDQPFFMYLSHKAVHSQFQPAERHEGLYQEEAIVYPPSFDTPNYGTPELPTGSADSEPLRGRDYYGQRRIPDWVKQQRESWHGVDYMYHGDIDFEKFFRRYTETLMGIDDSVGAVLDYLDANGLAEDTLVIYMGDNGFSFGEHGLIDKRHFYEESAKVPLLVRWPSRLQGGALSNHWCRTSTLLQLFWRQQVLACQRKCRGLRLSLYSVAKRFPGAIGYSMNTTGRWISPRHQQCLVYAQSATNIFAIMACGTPMNSMIFRPTLMRCKT